MTRSDALRPALLLTVLVLLAVPLSAQHGDDLTVIEISEAGTVFDPADGTIPRYVAALSPTLVLYEERNFFGQAIGALRRAGDLTSTPPARTTRASDPLLFEGDGVTPFSDPTVFHPTLVDVGSGVTGLYVLSNLPTGTVHFFSSVGGTTWVRAGSPVLPGLGGGSGILGTLRADDPSHAEGTVISVYYQTGGGALRVIQSLPSAVGAAKFLSLDPATDKEILPGGLVPGGFTATGAVVRFPGGGYGIFFVPQTDGFIGLAESVTPTLGWTITRGASDPILSTSTNTAAADGARSEIKELSLYEVAGGLEGYFVGAIPGQPIFTRSLGRIRIDGGGAFAASPPFVRGDANSNGAVDIVDALFIVQFLFTGGSTPECGDAADTNDDGGLDLTDPIYLLLYQYSGGTPPFAPFPSCGNDATGDLIDCPTFSGSPCAAP